MRALLASPPDLEQAFHTCMNGVLAHRSLSLIAFRAIGDRLIEDAILPFEEIAAGGS